MSSIKHRLTIAVSAGAVSLAGIAGIANAATQSTTTAATSGTTGASGAQTKHNANETALTGDTLKSASDAAIAANPGASVQHASTEDPAEGTGAAYEVHIKKADGSRAVVLEDSAFKVLSTKADKGHHGGGHKGNANEKALTGTTLSKANAAAEAAVAGSSAQRATTEDPAEKTGAAYEVHVKKADGSRVEVLLDSNYKVVKTIADTHASRGA